ncbi:MAG: Fur family transcriptional regulator [Candidatus Glassbacteria bacterium]
MRNIEELIELWREAGNRLTPQRLAIFQVLYGNRSHPTAEDIHQSLIGDYPSLSRNTVYSTLDKLTKMGEIREVFIERSVSHFDPDDHPHAHTICRSCGRIEDIRLTPGSPLKSQVQSLKGFKAEKFQIVISGLCRECKGKAGD